MVPKNHKAFTLVELLVVIAIIAILMGILLPVLGAARRQAAKTKCAAQMRELGNAMMMYVNANSGYLPTVRLKNKYDIDGILFDKGNAAGDVPGKIVDENVKWWNFLGKYITKQRTMAQNADDAGYLQRSVFWCPSFDGYIDTGNPINLQGGVNRNATGIGMNCWPTLRPDYPAAQMDADGFPSNKKEKFWDGTSSTANGGGSWYKVGAFTKPSDRALLADSRQFYLEAKSVAAGAQIPGQRLNFITQDYSSFGGQAMFDFYRHGKYPKVQDSTQTTGYFFADGGKISYNILYADGHVDSPVDREGGYRACRMRFPG